jgi:hypothetical protein
MNSVVQCGRHDERHTCWNDSCRSDPWKTEPLLRGVHSSAPATLLPSMLVSVACLREEIGGASSTFMGLVSHNAAVPGTLK